LGTLRVARDVSITPSFAGAFGLRDILLNCVGFLPIPLRNLAHYDFLDVAWAVRIEMAFYLAVFFILTASATAFAGRGSISHPRPRRHRRMPPSNCFGRGDLSGGCGRAL
jgi:hypothetical protein